MSEQQREHVSALADGELETLLVGPTISALEANADLKAAWERYSLIGSALRGEALRPEYRQIAARVSEELAAGPIPLSASRP
ncbi:MAG: sigma-E factor negative regulatory protein, partial [Chromatiaceae bacterium]